MERPKSLQVLGASVRAINVQALGGVALGAQRAKFGCQHGDRLSPFRLQSCREPVRNQGQYCPKLNP
jgi:hypothetical protein